jgi:hypothetical protein
MLVLGLSNWTAEAYVPGMNGFARSGCRASRLGVIVGLALLVVGCASTKVDWNSQLGIYTYDQAVVEMGPPEKSATLSDGTIVAEWMTRRGTAGGYTDAYYYYGPPRPYPYWRGYYYPPTYFYDPPTPAYFLRLIFDPDGRLTDWRRLAR